MDNLNITQRQNKNVTVLDLEGQIRLGTANIKLRETLRELAGQGKHNVLINLANVAQIDSSGLGELVGGYVSIKKSGGEIKLLHLNSRVQELMVITKLYTVFDVYENEDEAVASFQISEETAEKSATESVTQNLDKTLIAS